MTVKHNSNFWSVWPQWPVWPQGPQWPQWPSGANFNWLGARDPLTAYVVDDAVEYNWSSYVCINPNTNSQPDTNPADWDLFVSKWDQWIQWPQGIQGIQWPVWPQGPQWDKWLNRQGTYNGATAYDVDDAVEYNGTSYVCIQAGTGNQPDVSPAFWDVLAEKWDQGIPWPSWSGINPRQTATSYSVDEIVEEDNALYRCNTAHTSWASFAGDIANRDVIHVWLEYMQTLSNPDLSSLILVYDPTIPWYRASTLQSVVNIIRRVDEVPTGSINGTNTSFTITQDVISGSEFLYINGVFQKIGVDYTRTGTSISMTTAPVTWDTLYFKGMY